MVMVFVRNDSIYSRESPVLVPYLEIENGRPTSPERVPSICEART